VKTDTADIHLEQPRLRDPLLITTADSGMC
jgi:hypothetical protein